MVNCAGMTKLFRKGLLTYELQYLPAVCFFGICDVVGSNLHGE